MNAGMRFGPQITPTGITFRLWAPVAKRVDLVLDRPHPMQPQPDGWYELTITGARAGTRYQYRIDGEIVVPDPASHFQPEDVFGPSEVIDHTQYQWRATWRGRAWQDTAVLELHVGTFTPSGTFCGVIDKLDHVRDTGLTAIELMPIADFAGRRNWGYDGVLLYAPDSTYGRPDDLKRLIDEAHLRGLMVFLDVVYNHFGPEGNYLGRYAPGFFTAAHTPWGSAIDYRVPQVRAFAIDNALHWLQHYRFDGLRLDAVHAIVEPGEPPFLHELSRTVGEFAVKSGRAIHLILENDDNRAALIDPDTASPHGKYRAQWNDDYHHAWHVLLTGEHTGYYDDYADDPHRHLARALSCGFAYQGEPSAHRGGRHRGESSASLPPIGFVNFLQNHDQIGNRPLGDRLSTQTDSAALEAALAITLLAPMPPLLFMGEEWGSTAPFAFFCDFHGGLADAVRKGRRAEFKAAYERFGAEIPDPLEEQTFRAAVLDWHERVAASAGARLDLVRGLLMTRQADIAPHLAGARFGPASVR
ncbi:MAG TPA: malto-oligosyltrehalose trehalohydrolase, partial [Xanthobacteraceae bacterium]|nr:malto-oligosyltrehalose trehalohydrolase [Xanthobacteraceae bacterium]